MGEEIPKHDGGGISAMAVERELLGLPCEEGEYFRV